MFNVVVTGTEKIGGWEREFSLPSFIITNCTERDALLRAKRIVGERQRKRLNPDTEFFYSIEKVEITK